MGGWNANTSLDTAAGDEQDREYGNELHRPAADWDARGLRANVHALLPCATAADRPGAAICPCRDPCSGSSTVDAARPSRVGLSCAAAVPVPALAVGVAAVAEQVTQGTWRSAQMAPDDPGHVRLIGEAVDRRQ